jgi:hypothetical protein
VIPARATSSPDLAKVAAKRLAPTAAAWLRSGRPARALHVFDRAAYLVNDQGDILLLAIAPLGMGPFTLLAEGPSHSLFEWLSVDDLAVVRDECLDVGRLSVRLGTSIPWNASPDWETVRRHAAWTARVHEMRQILSGSSRRGVFASLVFNESESSAVTIDDRLARTARSAADDLLEALPGDDEKRLARCASALAGLGPGFTPSGDDFLMGMMFACWVTNPAVAARRRSRWLAAAAVSRTTRASAAWLAAAARGEAAEAWHRLFTALVEHRGGEVQSAAHQLLQTGHTSGEDALIGFVRGVESLQGQVVRQAAEG